jgi:hypothetical protein
MLKHNGYMYVLTNVNDMGTILIIPLYPKA